MATPEIPPFVQVPSGDGQSDEITTILTILEKRLPKSCFIYNAVKMAPRFPHHTKIFYMNPKSSCARTEVHSHSWIVLTHMTEDHGQNILISSPSSLKYSSLEKAALVETFASCSAFNWEEPHWFIALDAYVARIITKVSTEVKRHNIETYPDTLMYMEKDDDAMAQKLEGELDEAARNYPTIQIKPLDVTHGTQFISSTWKCATPKTHLPVARFLQNNVSGGVYLAGSEALPVSGILLHADGLLSMLHTSEAHRGKGFAKFAMKLATKEILKSGLFPASSVDPWNTPSLKTHDQLGFKNAGLVFWIMYELSKEKLAVLNQQ
ncbi:uncharacterized protein LOC118432914 [Folsomia candida]|uniref:uncharacterized protein LOC118432914 n=1 Tax=Folsomia candida TaxID=158441 RepID=UPI0016055641|nr:uncharacterized protein LOC118432914 [Folsomia candida]